MMLGLAGETEPQLGLRLLFVSRTPNVVRGWQKLTGNVGV